MTAALVEGNRARREYLHSLELPVAQLCALTSNLNRDSRKNRKPYDVADFCFFVDRDGSKPEDRAAAAYMQLVERDELPAWALFCFPDMKHGKGKPYSGDPALAGDGLLLLAPVEIDNGFRGLLLAEQRVAGRAVRAVWNGDTYTVQVPRFEGYTVALAGSELDLLSPPP